jgi:uncharacterized repeat protein (TIGR02543 family)
VLLAAVVSIACAVAFAFPTLALAEGGTVKVTGSDATYGSLTEAAAAVKTNGTKGDITYTVSGTADFDGGHGGAYNTLAPAGVTSVTIKGTNNAQVNLTGSYEVLLYTTPNGRDDGKNGVPLSMSDLTLNDRRPAIYEAARAWELYYLGSNAAEQTFTNVTFTEGYMVGSASNTASSYQTATFKNCTFGIANPSYDNDDVLDGKREHYELWLSGQAKATVDSCVFTPNNYGAIKGTYSNTYPMYYPKPHVELAVTSSTFNGIGHHRVVHLDGVDDISFTNNTITNCLTNKSGSTKQFIDATVDNSNGKVAAINADYFGDNKNGNTIQYSLELTKDGQKVADAPAYYQYNQTLDSYSVGGYTYSLDNGATFVDNASMLPKGANPGRYATDDTHHVFSAGALSGDDKTSIPVSSSAPRTYELVKPMAIKYIIAFDKNADDATGSMTSIDAAYDTEATLQACAFSRKGYTFAGWNTKADGTGDAYADAATVKNLTTEDGATVTLYAQWKQITHTVTFSDPEGKTTTPAQTVADGATATTPQDPTREGYVFAGWHLDGIAFDFKLSITKDITLVATWTKVAPVTHTVTFSDPEGKTTTPAQTVNDGATATAPQDPTRDGYTFDGWYLDGEKYDFSTPVTEDITLVAKWAETAKEASPKTEPTTAEKPEPPAAPKPAPKAPAAKVPNTSDATMPVYALVALVAGGAALVVMSSRKRNRS